jgi:hypothetical protein
MKATQPIVSMTLGLLTSLSALAADAPYGSKDFYPTRERPVGWRGNMQGVLPEGQSEDAA